SDRGKVYCERAFAIPETQRHSKGTLIHAVLPLMPDEHITAVLPVSTFDVEGYFVMATKHGRIKRVHLEEFADVRPSGLIAISLEPGDTLNWVKYTNGNQHIMIATDGGQAVRFHENTVRVMGRQAVGVNAIRLRGDSVAGMDVIDEDDTHLLVVTANGHGKRTALDEYSARARHGAAPPTPPPHPHTRPPANPPRTKATPGIPPLTPHAVL